METYTFNAKEYQYSKDKFSPKHAEIAKSIIWQETFDIGNTTDTVTQGPSWTTANGVWTTGGANGNVWKHSFYAASGQYSTNSEFLPTTQADGFMIFDADSNDFANGNTFATVTGEIISPTIDLSLETSVMLVMEQEFRFCCSGTHNLFLQVSSDNGATWGTPVNLADFVGANDEYSSVTGSYSVARNITAEAAGSSTVRLKFTWDGNGSGASHYWWAFDDICLTQANTNDLISKQPFWGVNGWEYYQIPTTQVAPVDFSSIVFNNGDATQTNITLDVDVNTGAWTSSSNVIASLATNAFDTLVAANQYTPAAAVGSHNVTWMINQNETEDTPADNTNAAFSFDVTNWIYARDNGVQASNIWGQGQEYEVGNLFDMFTDQILYSVEVDLSTFTDIGAEIQARVYQVDWTQPTIADAITQIATSDYHIVVGADLNGMLNLPLINPVLLTNVNDPSEPSYFVTLYSAGTGGVGNDMVVNTAGGTGDCWWLSPTTGEWTTVSRLPMIRMNLEDNTGITENTLSGIAVYPNPSEGLITVTNKNGTDNTIYVYDLVGNLLVSKEVSTDTTIDLSSVSTGMYVVKVSNDQGTYTENVVIK
jgi:hypothetical protein